MTKFLICTAGPEPARRIVNQVVKVVSHFEADSKVLNILPHRSQIPNKELRNRGEEATGVIVEALRKEGLETESILRFSEDIVDGIIETTKEINPDLMILGVGKKPKWYQFSKPNVSDEITHRVNCPVLILPKEIKNSPF